MDFARRPIAVDSPVETTKAFACPATTKVPSQTIFFLSEREVLLGKTLRNLSTGRDSPVNEDSTVLKFFISINLQSDGTLSPSSNITISPGTRFLDGICINSEFLRTFVWRTIIFFRDFIAFSALYS